MAYKLQLKRGASGSLPTGSAGEPLFTTDTNDLYIGTGASNQRYQKYIASGTSSQFLKGDGSLDSNTYYLASNPSAYIALTALTASAPLSYNNTTGAFTIAQASGSANGYLSSTDWTTFNNKQNALTNPVTGTGTTNYLPKWTSGSALGNSLVYDSGTNLGIGTSVPASKLSVLGDITLQLAGAAIRDVANQAILSVQNTNEIWLGGGGAGYITKFYADGSERMRLTSTGLGIGTTSPSVKLQVDNGTHNYFQLNSTVVNVQTAISAQNTSSGKRATLSWEDGTRGDFAELYSSTYLAFTTASSEKMRLTSGGNLGLGVVPSAWGTFTAIQVTTGGAFYAYQNPFEQIGIVNNGYFNGSGWIYTNSGSNSSRYHQYDGQHLFYTAPSGTAGNAISFTQAMTLDASGNLGLGTTSPTGRLHLYGTNPAFRIQNNGTGNMQFGQWDGTNNRIEGSGRNLLLQVQDANAMIFGTDASERLRITSGGNVLVNTTTTSDAKLDVYNDSSNYAAYFRANTLYAGGYRLMRWYMNGNNVMDITGDSSNISFNNNQSGFISFGTAGAERLRITSGGNVGIGTTSPYAKLSIVQDITTTAEFGSFGQFTIQGATNANKLLSFGFNTATDVGFIQAMVNGTSYNNLLLNARGGNVGIGTTSPSEKLEVNGNIKATNLLSGTYTPTLTGVYNVASSTAYELQYMRVGNVVTVSGYIQASATAANTWTRISITLPISSTFDYSYRAGGGGGASATNNVCAIQAGAFGTSVVYLDSYPNTTSALGYTFSFTYLIM